ncbi:MAG: hypothetical protein EB101_08355 [Chitinophagia bacterium]|nr:hypothetical protein [Chitinophagia bacterium]
MPSTNKNEYTSSHCTTETQTQTQSTGYPTTGDAYYQSAVIATTTKIAWCECQWQNPMGIDKHAIRQTSVGNVLQICTYQFK